MPVNDTRYRGRGAQRGLGLIELMIAITLGLVVSAAALTLFAVVSRTSSENLNGQRLLQELRATLAFMARDLRRAGYWQHADFAAHPGAALTLSDTSGSIGINAASGTPFDRFGSAVGLTLVGLNGRATITSHSSGSQAGASVSRTFDTDALPQGSWRLLNPFDQATNPSLPTTDCLLYQYDVNANNQVDGEEQFGMRLQPGGTTVERRTGGGAYSCGAGTWEPLTSGTVTRITGLTFALAQTTLDLDGTGIGTSTITIRDLTITLRGQLAGDPTTERELTETVRLRTDHYEP